MSSTLASTGFGISKGGPAAADAVFEFSSAFADAVALPLVPSAPEGVTQLTYYETTCSTVALAAYVCGILLEYGADGRREITTWIATYLIRKFPSLLKGQRVMGMEFQSQVMPAAVAAHLDGSAPTIPHPDWDSMKAARLAEKKAAEDYNKTPAGSSAPMKVPKELDDADRPDVIPPAPGLDVVSIDTSDVEGTEFDAFLGLSIWAFRQTVDQYTTKQFTTHRRNALWQMLGYTKDSPGPLGVMYPDLDYFRGLSQLGNDRNAAVGLIISRLAEWDRTSVSDLQRPLWAAAQLLGDHGTGGIMHALRFMRLHEGAVNNHVTLVRDAFEIMPAVKGFCLADPFTRKWVKAIHGSNVSLTHRIRAQNITGAGRMLAAAGRVGSSIKEDFGMRSCVAKVVRDHLVANGATVESTQKKAI